MTVYFLSTDPGIIMMHQSSLREALSKEWKAAWAYVLFAVAATFFSMPAFAQQTGDIAGRVTNAADGSPVAGVTIRATSPVLPGARSATTSASGDYRLPLLPPGDYTITYTLNDQSTRTRVTAVLLQQRSVVDLALEYGGLASTLEEVVVVGTSTLTDTSGASISGAISNEVFDTLPVGQEYRDLIKLIPGVQYSEDLVRGPSAGGSGQDNVYQFDGVDVSLPFFGTLSAEPSSHDIDQVSVVRGGAKAIGFNRSGGFTINTKSKSGTDEFHGSISYQIQTAGMTGDRETGSASEFEEDRDWTVASFSGPIAKDRLYFYGSYYAPTIDRVNRANAYGEVPDFDSERDEYFGKLTWAVSDDLLLEASLRSSDRSERNSDVGQFTAASASQGSEAAQDITILEGSWIINADSSAYFKFTDFENLTASRPDTLFNFPISVGGMLDVNNLDQQGFFNVPTPIDGEDAYNAFIQPLIDRYGYLDNGVATGGGGVGGASTINDQDFFRQSFELGYDLLIVGDGVEHDLHFGYKWSKDEEDLARLSNGWGSISVIGGRSSTDAGEPIFYQATFNQQSLLTGDGTLAPSVIHSETESQSIEINDTITRGDWTYSIGVMLSNDELFGQGLKPNSSNISGFELAPGHKYLMKEVDFDEMIQPRLGATWDFNDRTKLYANYARYYPAATSLARAASWGRNLRRTRQAWFDADGNFLDSQDVRSSSGKFFQEGIDPRKVDEYLIGGSYEFSDSLTGRAHIRYRAGRDFWEDTNNNARVDFEPPPGIPRELYVPNLDEVRAEIGGSSFVIAQLDDGHTDYYEASFEVEWWGENAYLQASYVWSEYTGNFDQDNTSSVNDANRFIGSSNLADDAGRQLWDLKDGTLRGDRTHQLKVYGFYELPWNATVGAYFIFQSGQPWEAWNVEFYRDILDAVGSRSTSDTIRYSERAGSRTSASHNQLDLNYTQNFYFGGGDRYNIQLRAELFNVFDKQTGYNIEPRERRADFGEPRSFFNPRRLRLTAKLIF